jgi:uncharacterized protein YciI
MSTRRPWLPLLLVSLAACGSTPSPTVVETAPSAPPTAPPPAQSPAYTLVWIRTGPRDGQLPQEERAAAFAGHFSNMERLAEERKLLLAGPFGAVRHAADLRGIFVLATAEAELARAWAASDPTTQAGVFVLEQEPLTTAMPLSAMLEAELARAAARRAAGETPKPGEGARGWALLVAEHGDLARRELAPLVSHDGGVFLLGELGGGRALAVLDAANAAEARERFGPELSAIGAHTLDDWFATDLIATLAR